MATLNPFDHPGEWDVVRIGGVVSPGLAKDSFVQILKYDPTKQVVQAVDIFHPALAFLDVTSVVTEEIGAILHDGEGLYSISVSFIEYFPVPAISAVSTPSGSKTDARKKADVPGTPVPTAQDQYEQQAADLLKTAQGP